MEFSFLERGPTTLVHTLAPCNRWDRRFRKHTLFISDADTNYSGSTDFPQSDGIKSKIVKTSHSTRIVLQKLLLIVAFQKTNIVRQMCGDPHYTMALAEFTLTDGGVPPFVPHCAPIWPQTGPSWHHQGARWCLSTKPLICHQICLRYSPFRCLKCRKQTGIPKIVHATSPLGQ